MTPEQAGRKMAEIQSLHDSLEPHAAVREVAVAQQALISAGQWLCRVRDGKPVRPEAA